ncbi:hydrophobic/amphiphilic exporter-1, HAE1 family [Abditibacterium utsteinense]|uniref:Hydrophobic/amphiphilic exporter-1, HAE1 family n=1 Tax=Abditibacterium utsteinense TaxID=1960156 RepID=A0A2S8SUI8_9BACT|nr:efflux RND transporter permease subunit [Abditibacterium utsteinense]PQV64419.1 hydrophobic/amphiphilic exporter-1, HAE1 family [Abditibacterium utsteinense]
MQKLAEICIKRPVFASVLILILVVVGAAGFFQLGVDRFPNVDFATVTITTSQPGASPESVETEITQPIEEAVNTISGMDDLRSYSNEGVSIVICQFLLEKNVDVAESEVRAKVNRVVNQLPDEADQPIIEKQDTGAAPVLGLALSGRGTIKEITEYADKILRRRIESTPGVGRIDVLGGRGRQINVYLDAYKMRGYDVTVTDVTRALQQQNVDIPGGRIDQGDRSLTLRTAGRILNVADFSNVSIKAQDGGAILLQDIARVEDGIADAASVSEINGQSTVYLQVAKQSGTNAVAVISQVKARIEQLRPAFEGAGYTVRVVNDQSQYIDAAIKSVEEHLIVGSILASVVVLIFLLNWRSTMIAAISIPASIIATFGLMWIMGFTLNVITLLALTLSVGIVIDDAIVVLENIYRFIEEKGMDPFEAAIEGTREIGLAVLATTLSLVAVFLPVAFMTGIVGRFMNSFGLTMAFAIMVSLVVAFTLTPTLSARLLKAPKHKEGASNSKTGGFFSVIDRFYTALLKWSLGHRWAIGILCFLALFSMKFTIPLIPKDFLPKDDESQFQVTARAPEGTSLERTRDIARDIAAQIKKQPEVEYTVVTIGGSGQSAARNNSSIYVRLKDIDARTRSQDEMIAYARSQILPKFAAEQLRTTVGPSGGVGGGGVQADVLFTLGGPDLDVLERASQKMMSDLRRVPNVTDVDSSLIAGRPELAAQVDRPLAAQLGVQPADVAQSLNFLVGDNEVTNFQQGGEQYEVHVRAAQKFRSDEAGLSLLTVPGSPSGGTNSGGNNGNSGGTVVPLDQVVKFVPQTGPASIQRLNRNREVTVQANILPGGSAQDVLNSLNKSFAAQNLGPEYRGAPTGRSKEQGKAFVAFITAFGLSLIFVYLILAAQFESWLHPITILLSLPLTVPFAMLSLVIFQGSLNIFSLLGVLVLFGVVKKNAILQIDHTNTLRGQGMERNAAIIQANRDRLRPILMTTLAFVAGMLPLVISTGVGSGTNRAIGSVIFGGQTMSLILTLLATPVAYSLFDDLSGATARLRNRIFGGKAANTARPEAMARASSEK